VVYIKPRITIMLSPTMRTTVLHATTLFTISIMLNHHLGKNMFDQVLEDEGWLNMTSAYNKSAYASTSGTPHGLLPIDAGKPANQTLPSAYGSNGTARKGTLDAYEESFYCGTLPRKVVIFVVVTAIQYWWFLALEKMLPARPSRFQDAVQSEKVLEGGGDREEEVVKRWIAKGRVRRTSLNWCNTFLKWLLDMTVGTLWYHTVEHFVMKVVLKLQSYSGPAPRGLKGVRRPSILPHLALVLTAK
jgi:hypothetical protein